jgi:hypothetical protein
MSTDIAQPTRQAIAAKDRSLPGRVTGRLLVAINAMVWQAASRKEAAVIAKMTDHSLRQALKRRHVMDRYLQECEVLRLSGRAKRLHRLEQIAGMDRNLNASVAAIKVAEQLADDLADGRARGSVTMPGLIIQVINAPAVPCERVTRIDVKPEAPMPALDDPTVFRSPWQR